MQYSHVVTGVPIRIRDGLISRLSAASQLEKVVLPSVWALQALVSLILMRNTAFQDEALYLYAGRQLFEQMIGGPHVTQPYATYFSGYPYLYPILAGILDKIGGIELARLFSLLAIMVTTYCVFHIALRLYGERAAMCAAFVFGLDSSVLFVSRLATYDALCLCLLAIALLLAVCEGRAWWASCAAIGPLLVLAVGVKYAALLFCPSVFVVLGLLAWRMGWRQSALRVGIACGALLITLALALAFADKQLWEGLSFTTTNRTVMIEASRLALVSDIAVRGGLVLALACIGFGLSLASKRDRLITFVLIGSAFLAPLYHVYKGEFTSLDKHVAFAMLFAAPVAGFAITRISRYVARAIPSAFWLTELAICLVMLLLSIQQLPALFTTWGNSTAMTEAMRATTRPSTGHYLAEDMEVCRYYLHDVAADWQWVGPYFFVYETRQHTYVSGESAYAQATDDGYFDSIQVSYGSAFYWEMLPIIQHSKRYTIVARVPYTTSYGSGYYVIWRKNR